MTMNKDPESTLISIPKVGQVKAFHICEPPASSEYLCRMGKARGLSSLKDEETKTQSG